MRRYRFRLSKLIRLHDGVRWSNPATVTITVLDVNVRPDVEYLDVSIAEDASLSADLPISDFDGDALQLTMLAPPEHGSASLQSDFLDAPPRYSFDYAPQANYHGVDVFVYYVDDGHGGTASAVVTVTVNPVNDAPTAADDSATAVAGQPLTIAFPGVLGNDSDVDGDLLSAILVDGPAHGTLTLNANGSFTYTPAAGYEGSDSFTYQAQDGTTNSLTATVTLTVLNGEALQAPDAETSRPPRAPPTAEEKPSQETPAAEEKPSDKNPAAEESPTTSDTLTVSQLQTLLQEAIARWVASGTAASAVTVLPNMPVQVLDLPGSIVGFAGANAIWIDHNAAGHGWFLDATPWDDDEFTAIPGDPVLQATATSPAESRIDLLTVLLHELGHVLGLHHEDGEVMEPVLEPGRRWLLGDDEHAELLVVPVESTENPLPAPGRPLPANASTLLALEEEFPRQALAWANGLVGGLAYPIVLLPTEIGALLRSELVTGPRTAGSDDTVLLGGDGEDLVIGERGRDRLVGGIGGRRSGDGSEDTVVARTSRYQVREDALHALLVDWTEADDYLNLLNP
jgi:VCBS repeat-containing protein